MSNGSTRSLTSAALASVGARAANQIGKVIPPTPVLADRLEADVRDTLNRRIAREILTDRDLHGQVEAVLRERRALLDGWLATPSARSRPTPRRTTAEQGGNGG
jgi:hypothetical protein